MSATATTDPAPVAGRHFLPPPGGPSRRWLTVFASLLALSVAAAAVLTYLGIQTVRESRAGRSVSTVVDPARPGFEAFLEPTPTLVVLDGNGTVLRSAAVLSLRSGDVGGSVLLVPPDTRLGDDPNALTLGAVAAFEGSLPAAVPGIQDLLGIGIAEVAVVDDQRWAELVAPVAPLTIENPDPVGPFPAGTLSLAATDVASFLGARGEGESDLARLYREQLVFDAWLDAVATSSDPGAVPGEGDTGLGRFLRGLAAGDREIRTLPVVESPAPTGTHIDVDVDAALVVVAELVPFPTAANPGGRIRVRLLDGSGDPNHVLAVAPLIVPAPSEIVVVGNADAFDYETTEIRYHDPVRKASAETLREVLGAGRVVSDPRPTDAFDVTIVLGTDI